MLSFLIFCYFWFLQSFLSYCQENSTGLQSAGSSSEVVRLSVPENHNLCLRCGGSGRSEAVWTHGGRRVPVGPDGNDETDGDHHYRGGSDRDLCLHQLDDSDDGEYGCNGRVVAELQVLTAPDVQVSAGWTLLLPCRASSRTKQRWFHRRRGGRREPIFTRFRNGTVKPEREGGRLRYENDALHILNLQPEDAGEYQCSGELQVRVTVLTGPPRPTSIHSSTTTTTSPAVTDTDVVKIKKKEKKRPENALLLVAVVGFGLMIVLLAAVCVLLLSMRCRRKKKCRYATAQRLEDTELQPWTTTNTQTEYEVFESPSLPKETIHYASLGRQNWRERPSRTPPNQDRQDIIYSAVIPRPAVRS